MLRTVTTTRVFEEYAAEAWPRLYRFAYLLSGRHADAEDLAQEALLKAHRSWPKVQAAASPDAYVRRILANTYLSGRRPAKARLEVLTDRTPEGPSDEGRPEERWVLWPHVKALPPRQRAVVVLRYYEDLSEQQIAETLGCSVGTVKSTAHRALASLRTGLEGSTRTGRGESA